MEILLLRIYWLLQLQLRRFEHAILNIHACSLQVKFQLADFAIINIARINYYDIWIGWIASRYESFNRAFAYLSYITLILFAVRKEGMGGHRVLNHRQIFWGLFILDCVKILRRLACKILVSLSILMFW